MSDDKHSTSVHIAALAAGAVPFFPTTYFPQHNDGDFYETTAGHASYEATIAGILDGNLDKCKFVWRAENGQWRNVSPQIADIAYSRWIKDEAGEYVPPFLLKHRRADVERECERRMVRDLSAFDRAENDADAAYDRQREVA